MFRPLSLLLIPCLLADPALAGSHPFKPSTVSPCLASQAFNVSGCARYVPGVTRLGFLGMFSAYTSVLLAQKPIQEHEVPTHTPLSPEQQVLLRQRVNFFADRY